MSNSTVDVAAFCKSAAGEEALVICAVNEDLQSAKTGLNTFFLIFAGSLVFMMQAGFAMLCAGSVRRKNMKNVLLKNFLDVCGAAVGFYTIGYGIAYGGDQTGLTFAGNGDFGLRDFQGNYAFFFFEFGFAATAATIVAGTVAERCKMSAYLCYSFFLSAFVYPVIVHSIWSENGFLSGFAPVKDRFQGVGVIDFAGSGVVHMVGGLTALIAAAILGPRIGRFHDEEGNLLEEPVIFPPHNIALQILGTFLLWFGWYGFNPGSALKISDSVVISGVSALAAVTTTMAAASGCVTCTFADSIVNTMKTGETSYNFTAAMNGTLAGLVAITAGCSIVTPWAAILIGAVAGLVYLAGSHSLINLRIDDAVDAIAVHLFNGVWGLLAVGFFAEGGLMANAGYSSTVQGWFYELSHGSGNGQLLLAQIAGIAFIVGWVTCIMAPFFLLLNWLGMLRVDSLEDDVGLDVSHHPGAASDLLGASMEQEIEVPKEDDAVVQESA